MSHFILFKKKLFLFFFEKFCEQCPKTVTKNSTPSPKLGWVHWYTTNGPWLRVHYVVSWRAVCRVAGLAPTMSQACRAPAWLCRGLSRDTPNDQATRCVVTHKAAPPVAIQFVSRLSLASPCSCHDTNDCIVTHLNGRAALLSRYN